MIREENRVVVVANNAGTAGGGESMLPWQYFRLLNARGVDAHLVTHERNRSNLYSVSPTLIDRMHFVTDRRGSRAIQRMGRRLPRSVKALTIWVAMSTIASGDLRRLAASVASRSVGPSIVHEPAPVSPRQPSFMTIPDVAVLVGPLNGGMSYPDGFRDSVRMSERLIRWFGRKVSDLANTLIRGKADADRVLVANDRTRSALPSSVDLTRVEIMVENGVDLETFDLRSSVPQNQFGSYAFVGQLVDWKRVDLLLKALPRTTLPCELHIIGSGPTMQELEALTRDLQVEARVTFHGYLSQAKCSDILSQCNALLLASTYECGGAVVLEAMAVGLPVVATAWGGPLDYVIDGETGILLDVSDGDQVSSDFAQAIDRLTSDQSFARRLGAAGRARVEHEFSWEKKIDKILRVYSELLLQE